MIKIKKLTSVDDLRDANETCSNGRPSAADLATAYFVRHSNIRTQLFVIKCDNVYAAVCGHIVRHHVGTQPFVGTSRPDRGVDLEGVFDYRHMGKHLLIHCNAEALMNIAEQRLCKCAESDTQHFVWDLRHAMESVDLALAERMVPLCVREGFCHQIRCCDFINSAGGRLLRAKYIDRSCLDKA